MGGVKGGPKRKLWIAEIPKTTAVANKEGGMGTMQLLGIIFFCVCGGPYGIESAVKSAAPMYCLIGLMVVPFVWGLPMGLMAAELACAMPTDGGFVLWVHRGFGPFIGFINGVLVLLSAFVDNAAYPILAVNYLGASGILPDSIQNDHTYMFIISLGLVAVACVLNIFGVEIVGTFSLVLTFMVLLPFLAMLVTCGMWIVDTQHTSAMNHSQNITWPHYVSETWGTTPNNRGTENGEIRWGLFLSVLLWANAGFDEAGSVAERVHDPAKAYTRGTSLSVSMIAMVYILPVSFGVCVLGWEQWDDAAFKDVAEKSSGGEWLKIWLTLAAFFGCYGTYISLVCTTSLGLSCLAELEIVPSIFAYESPRWETPVVSIVFTSVVTGGMCYFNFDTVVQVGVVLYSFSLFLEWGSVLMLRFYEPEMHRPFVIPMRNGWLLAYFTIPMGLCIFTTYNVLQDAYNDLSNNTFVNHTHNHTASFTEGLVTVVGIGSSFAFAGLMYACRSVYRWQRGPVDESLQPLLSSSTLVHALNPEQAVVSSSIQAGGSAVEYTE